MKHELHPSLASRSILAVTFALVLALALVIWSPVQAQDAEPAEQKVVEKAKKDDKKMNHCQSMMQQKQKAAQEAKAQDVELAKQLAKMNSAPEGKKMELMAAVITLMVEQRAATDAREAKLGDAMMGHMMEHMPMDTEGGAQCPMMKGMGKETAALIKAPAAKPKAPAAKPEAPAAKPEAPAAKPEVPAEVPVAEPK
ncbi:MAG: hypothetical protein HYV27_15505 [Candidatus Hydrogenedentes bacterium]|nr:hypothetical protein [Candidatus Hydrogenedentota bacterium]